MSPTAAYVLQQQYRQFQAAVSQETNLQSARVAEEYLSKFDLGCLRRHYCEAATTPPTGEAIEAVESLEDARAMLAAVDTDAAAQTSVRYELLSFAISQLLN